MAKSKGETKDPTEDQAPETGPVIKKSGNVSLKRMEGELAVLTLEGIGNVRIGAEGFPADFDVTKYDVRGDYSYVIGFIPKG